AGYAVAIMHLLTHGFFKAGLFLGAGSVMHAMNDDTDMRRYGGLRTLLPITFVTFGLGYLAIIGVPPFAGYFSKDAIIEAAFNSGGTKGVLLGGAALLGAGITAFYMTRVMLLTFFGHQRWKPNTHPHESPATMTAPMIVLAIGSLGAGALLAIGNTLQHWLEPVVGTHETHHLIPTWIITVTALGTVAIGIAVAVRMYLNRPVNQIASEWVSALTVAARSDLYGDAFNEAALMRTGQALTKSMVGVERRGIDGAVEAIAAAVALASSSVRRTQTGFARSYALSMFVGATLVVAMVMVVSR
ncbi:proton-conducting transporter membrane subunit, partial [Mycolicibacterium sphagni]